MCWLLIIVVRSPAGRRIGGWGVSIIIRSKWILVSSDGTIPIFGRRLAARRAVSIRIDILRLMIVLEELGRCLPALPCIHEGIVPHALQSCIRWDDDFFPNIIRVLRSCLISFVLLPILTIALYRILCESFHFKLLEIFVEGPDEIPQLEDVFTGQHHVSIEERPLEMVVEIEGCLVWPLPLLITHHRALIPENSLLQNIALHGVVDSLQSYISQLVFL